MKKFKRRGAIISSHLDRYEIDLLRSLVGQLIEMVSEGQPDEFPAAEAEPTGADPFEFWAKDLQVDPDEPEVPEDPVLRRLFPNAYPHDAAAASDFRRYTERDLRAKKVAEAMTVLRALDATQEGEFDLRIPKAEADQWLRTLTSLRLSVATRLGITDAQTAEELAQLPEDDPRAFLLSVYDWLGFAQETLVGSL